MRNLRLILEYDGTDFSGFQRQLNKRTVQGELERSLSKILREPVKIIGAGRTDAGVHAAGQVANFLTSNPLPLSEARRVFNAVLPIDLAIRRVDEVALDFHSRRMARSRIYRYTVLNQPLRSARLGRFAGWVDRPLALETMNEACGMLRGEHDFAAFQAAGSPAKNTFRRLMKAACKRLGDIVWITIEADAFLYQMVRIIVSSLIVVGTGERPVEWMEALLKGRDRSLAPAPAAAQGLCLMKVTY
jgi:tRNA pseudouridine38-40 synthase